MRDNQRTYEISSWLRTLDYLQQENIQMKNLTAEIIKSDNSPAVLEQVEYFQNLFMNKDVVISFLRKDVKALQQNEVPKPELWRRQQMLRTDMEKIENDFTNLKSEVNKYLQGIVD